MKTTVRTVTKLRVGQVRQCCQTDKLYTVLAVGLRDSTIQFQFPEKTYLDFKNENLELDKLISEGNVIIKVKMKIKVEETVEVELTKEELSRMIKDKNVLNELFTADIYYYKDDNYTDKEDVGGDYQFEFVELV